MMGFEIYDIKTLERMLDHYALTDDGKLLKRDSHGGWHEVPERKEKEFLIISCNHDGRGEVY